MQNVTQAVIAAAGLGSRLGFGIPKCMVEIEGVTILTRLINRLRPYMSIIHLVVGYREEMVIEYCAQHHRDVVLVRNSDFRTTNTATSCSKGSQLLTGKVLFLDGDLLITKESLENFLTRAQNLDILIGLTPAKSEDAIFVQARLCGGYVDVFGFSRTNRSTVEWANIFVGPSHLLDGANGFVFEGLNRFLPLPGCLLDLAEVDTIHDLAAAQEFVKKFGI